MTVAAVIPSATADGAVADTLAAGAPIGRPRVVRRGAAGRRPCTLDRTAVTAALAGSEAVRLPAPPETGPNGQMVRGTELAMSAVSDTTAFSSGTDDLGRPEYHLAHRGTRTDRASMLRPAWHASRAAGLVPTAHLDALRAIASDRMPPSVIDDLAATVPTRVVEVGDPGVIHDVDTAPDDLPAYEGPPDPPAGHTHEWGADVAAEAGLEPA
jgi:hypothetical protein